MKIKSYKIVTAAGVSSLELKVMDEVREGWQPLGGPFVSKNDYYSQALVKYEAAQNHSGIKLT